MDRSAPQKSCASSIVSNVLHGRGLYSTYNISYFFLVKRLPEHIQVDDPAAQKKLAKKLERQQVGVRRGFIPEKRHGLIYAVQAWGTDRASTKKHLLCVCSPMSIHAVLVPSRASEHTGKCGTHPSPRTLDALTPTLKIITKNYEGSNIWIIILSFILHLTWQHRELSHTLCS